MVYIDLNVRAADGRVCAAELQRLGFATVAVNAEFASDDKLKQAAAVHSLPLTAGGGDGRGMKKSKTYTPAVANALQLAAVGGSQVRAVQQLKRVTLKVDDVNGAMAIDSSAAVKSFDIVAAEATSPKVFQFLCEQANVDVITFDITNRMPFQLKRPWVDAAIKRGVFFEIMYAPSLSDSAGRRYFFSNASNLVRVTGGRHLLLSSGATRDILLRAPYDVINIGVLVGLTYAQALDAVSSSGLDVIARAAKRRGKADVVLETARAVQDVVMRE
ncbi:hypothetical protein PybrP1_010514 [[Pythium] brassicae (nom. inval.)]|nr:hypothetical protein PybrP1_010514 [[Pythium] brassicae (nom. inval.)]